MQFPVAVFSGLIGMDLGHFSLYEKSLSSVNKDAFDCPFFLFQLTSTP